MNAKKKRKRTRGALSDIPKFTKRQLQLLQNEANTDDELSAVAAWPLDDEPIFIVYARKAPLRYWTAIVEYDWRLPEPLTEQAVRVAAKAYQEAQRFNFQQNPKELPGANWRWATRQERRESILLAYHIQNRAHAFRAGLILPPITKDKARIERKRKERERIEAALRGDLPIPQKSRLERIVAAYRLLEATGIDITEEIKRRELPDEDEEEEPDY